MLAYKLETYVSTSKKQLLDSPSECLRQIRSNRRVKVHNIRYTGIPRYRTVLDFMAEIRETKSELDWLYESRGFSSKCRSNFIILESGATHSCRETLINDMKTTGEIVRSMSGGVYPVISVVLPYKLKDDTLKYFHRLLKIVGDGFLISIRGKEVLITFKQSAHTIIEVAFYLYLLRFPDFLDEFIPEVEAFFSTNIPGNFDNLHTTFLKELSKEFLTNKSFSSVYNNEAHLSFFSYAMARRHFVKEISTAINGPSSAGYGLLVTEPSLFRDYIREIVAPGYPDNAPSLDRLYNSILRDEAERSLKKNVSVSGD